MEYEVVCVEIDSSSDYEDCRTISNIGYEKSFKHKDTPRTVHDKIREG